MLAVVGGSFVLHLAAWAFVGRIKGERKHETFAIALAEEKKKKEEKKDPPKPPPPPPKPEKAKVIERTKAPEPVVEKAPPPVEAKPASNMNGYADLGLGAMGGGTGGGMPIGGGGGGGGGSGPTQPAPTATQRHVALVPTGDCVEDLVKPKREHIVLPKPTQEAIAASISGVVRLEMTVDATGHVVNVKVLNGLGFGLDEAAVAAARQWTFAPATKCGKPVPATIKQPVRFGDA